MFRYIIDTIDAVLPRMTTVTTTTTTTRYVDCDTTSVLAYLYTQGIHTIRRGNDVIKINSDGSLDESSIDYQPVETSVDVEQGYVEIGDRKIFLPEKVKNRPPLHVGGKPNYASFPNYAYHDITVSYISKDDERLAYYRGEQLTRSRTIGRWSRKSVILTHTKTIEEIEKDETVVTSRVLFSDIGIAVSVCPQIDKRPGWIHLSATDSNESILQIHVTDTQILRTDNEFATMAFSLARAMMLTYASVGIDNDPDNETSIAAAILTLLLIDHTEAA